MISFKGERVLAGLKGVTQGQAGNAGTTPDQKVKKAE
jgi:hypothetical protein